MAEQTQKQRQTTKVLEKAEESQPPNQSKTEKLKADLDAIIDEIDEVLETEVAAAFVKSYVQAGGE